MLKKIFINKEETQGILYATDDEKEAESLALSGEAVLFVCENIERTPFIKNVKYITDDLEACDNDYFYLVYSRYKGLPVKVMETERTLIREICVADLPELYKLYNDEEIKKFVEPLYPYEEEKTFTEKYIENMYGVYGFGLWLVFDKMNHKLIGRAGISIRNIDGEDRPELGYIIGNEYRNKGFATEVCSAIMDYAFCKLQFEELYIVTEDENEASKRTALKLGFEHYSKMEKYIIFVTKNLKMC